MLTKKIADGSSALVDQVEHSADEAIQATQRAAQQALDSLAAAVQDARQQTAPLLQRAAEHAAAYAQRGVDGVRGASQAVQHKAQRASHSTVDYIQDEPVKAMLIAAATGAALMALISLISHSRQHG